MKQLPGVLTFLLLLLLVFTRCASHSHDDGLLANDYTIVPLNQFTFEPSGIKTGSEVSIFAFTGGKTNTNKRQYYSRFLVVDRATGDTTRILAALIGIDSVPGSESETYTTPDMFDGQKKVLDATFEEPNDKQRLMLNLTATSQADGSPDLNKVNAAITDTTGKEEYVLINKNADIFAGKYKTAKGILRFHNQPW
jgi:hypothetical protein